MNTIAYTYLTRIAVSGHASDLATARAACAAGRLWRVDTQGAGEDCVLDADSADAAIAEILAHYDPEAWARGEDGRDRGWTAERVTAIVDDREVA
jgi:hypothetical protein